MPRPKHNGFNLNMQDMAKLDVSQMRAIRRSRHLTAAATAAQEARMAAHKAAYDGYRCDSYDPLDDQLSSNEKLDVDRLILDRLPSLD